MLPVKKLNFGSNDAEDYRKKENKELFNKIFLRDPIINSILEGSRYFLVGEKGTGKTAYSVFLNNNSLDNTKSKIKFIRETEYSKFVQIINKNQLSLYELTLIWKVVLLLVLLEEIDDCINYNNPIQKFLIYRNLTKTIKEYYNNSFSGEISQAFDIIENFEEFIHFLVNSSTAQNDELSKSFLTNPNLKLGSTLTNFETKFKEALKVIKLNQSFILFIDGIDIRPDEINHEGYQSCVKSLCHALWELNNDFLGNIKDLGGKRIKIMLLIRPDILVNTGLQNINNKIRNNSVLLDWKTIYKNYSTSKLFYLADRLLSVQQEDKKGEGECWNFYFPYTIYNYVSRELTDNPFVDFLRYSFYRPRDIITLLDIMKETVDDDNKLNFTRNDFQNALSSFSDYLLGEIRDYLKFYYTEEEYEIFRNFFQFLKGRSKFTYDYFISCYNNYNSYLSTNRKDSPIFMKSQDDFLQFLYEMNIISYKDTSSENSEESFIHWSFRERSYANITPKVRTESEYSVHLGLLKALNLGQETK